MNFLIKLFICVHVVLIGSDECLTMKRTLKLFWPFTSKESPASIDINNSEASGVQTENLTLPTNPAQAEAEAKTTASDPNEVVVVGLEVTVTDEDEKLPEEAIDQEEDPEVVEPEAFDGYEKELYPKMPENPTDPLATQFLETPYDEGMGDGPWSNIDTAIGIYNFGEDAISRIIQSCQNLSLDFEVKKDCIAQRKKKSPHGKMESVIIGEHFDTAWSEILCKLQEVTTLNKIDEAIFLDGVLIALKLMKLHDQILEFKSTLDALYIISQQTREVFTTKITLIVHGFLKIFFQSFIQKNKDFSNYLKIISWAKFLDKVKINRTNFIFLQSCKERMDGGFDTVIDDAELPLELQIDRATGNALSILNRNVKHLNSIFVKHGPLK